MERVELQNEAIVFQFIEKEVTYKPNIGFLGLSCQILQGDFGWPSSELFPLMKVFPESLCLHPEA